MNKGHADAVLRFSDLKSSNFCIIIKMRCMEKLYLLNRKICFKEFDPAYKE